MGSSWIKKNPTVYECDRCDFSPWQRSYSCFPGLSGGRKRSIMCSRVPCGRAVIHMNNIVWLTLHGWWCFAAFLCAPLACLVNIPLRTTLWSGTWKPSVIFFISAISYSLFTLWTNEFLKFPRFWLCTQSSEKSNGDIYKHFFVFFKCILTSPLSSVMNPKKVFKFNLKMTCRWLAKPWTTKL